VMNSAVNGVLTVRSTWNSKLVDLADVNGTPLTTDGQFPVWDDGNQYFDFTANIADFDAAGSAAAAQASAIADAATKYYNQSVFSATPTAAEPLKADGSGGLSVKAFSNRGLVSLGNDVLAGLLTIQNGYVLRPITANGLSVAARVSTTQALDVYGSGTHTGYLQTWRENSTANPLLATDTAGFNWLNVTTGQKEISLSRSSAHRLSVIAVKTTTDDGQNIDLRFAGESSTTANQNMARLAIDWYVNTHASRQADVIAYASDYGGEREIWRGRATGSSPAIGFYGVTPTERQLLATGAGASVDDVITALQTLGLVKQS
ncbi:MAG: hypothetical protein KDD89_11800, partial [Anaerolineales bacterium]|nr:hypothetical protein [Anaerolineales bacterium]